MPLPSIFLGVTAKQLLVLVTVGCVAAYLFDLHDNTTPDTLALEAFVRSQEQVTEQVGAVLEIALVRQVVSHPSNNVAGYTRSLYAVEGERGKVLVALKEVEGEQGIEITQIRRP